MDDVVIMSDYDTDEDRERRRKAQEESFRKWENDFREHPVKHTIIFWISLISSLAFFFWAVILR